MATFPETTFLPAQFDCEPLLMEQISNRPGHQRCIVGDGELLLIVHDVPKTGHVDRDGLFFWKRRDEQWLGPSGEHGLSALGGLLERYSRTIDSHSTGIDEADTAAEIFDILRHTGPLVRSSRNLVTSLSQILEIDPDDRLIRSFRDRAVEIERSAEFLQIDTRLALEFWQAEQAEKHAQAADNLNRIAFRLNLLAGFFLPLLALGGLFGMNVELPGFPKNFWTIVLVGLTTGAIIVAYASRRPRDKS